LHNFIRDSKLRDHEFDKRDEDENYLLGAARATPQTQRNDETEVDNEESMNNIQNRLADVCL
jgi:hypothetical protein